ncbi:MULTISPECIES: ribonuclease J [Caproicibacterium]|uniref:Ribonuclease J n=1 Tax=Caproicibacterium argilliputei TaxID=3030016 RepID=A0AA97H249_9FIRM|nr:ribonuclease J [Caproicibacterium argilliputei]WOC33226.1 ribonuclease J [Caproicibacterium argilliputei]
MTEENKRTAVQSAEPVVSESQPPRRKPADQVIGGGVVPAAPVSQQPRRPRHPRRSPAKNPSAAAEQQSAKQEPVVQEQKQEQSSTAAAAPALQQEQPRRRPRRPRQKREGSQKPPIHIAFLGGLNEVGKNMTLFECQGDMFLLDCGMAFPDDDMLGVDLVLPDFTYVEKNADRIKGIVLTHGHEDHIGALPYLLKKVNLPLYGTPLTLGLVKGKLKEHGLLNKVKMYVTNPGDTVRFGCISVEMIHVNHSIPDAVGVAIHSPAGTIVHTGDFKIDCTPVWGEMIDLGRFAQLGKEGVLALMADSTNAERPGFTKTEQMIQNSFESMFRRAEKKRIIVASFASNISRVQQIVDCAVKYGRKVALSGRSMVNVMSIGVEMGYLHVPEGVLIDIDLIKKYPKEQIVLITTGSQGEPMSALSRMAFADHRKVEVGPDDFIIISARPIPGNEKSVGNVIDELMKRGCEVEYGSMYEVHVSGHACQEELKLMQGIVKPKYFIPVHGEQKMLHQHARLAYSMGKRPQDVCIADIGDVIELSEDHMKRLPGAVPAGNVLVDGLGVGDVGSIVLRDRKHLAEDGLIVVVCTIAGDSGHVVSGPDVVSRGFVYVRESENLMDDAKDLVFTVLEQCADNGIHDWGTLKTNIKDSLSRMLYDRTRRSPMILPIIMEV